MPFDKAKDYTWLIDIPHIDDNDMKRFLDSLNFNELLSEEENMRNQEKLTEEYYWDKNEQINVKSILPNCSDIVADVK